MYHQQSVYHAIYQDTYYKKGSEAYETIKGKLNDTWSETGLDSLLEGPTAIMMSEEDYLEPLKAIYKFAKDNEFYKIKGGVLEGKVSTVERYTTGNSKWQDLVVLVREDKTVTDSKKLSVEPFLVINIIIKTKIINSINPSKNIISWK